LHPKEYNALALPLGTVFENHCSRDIGNEMHCLAVMQLPIFIAANM